MRRPWCRLVLPLLQFRFQLFSLPLRLRCQPSLLYCHYCATGLIVIISAAIALPVVVVAVEDALFIIRKIGGNSFIPLFNMKSSTSSRLLHTTDVSVLYSFLYGSMLAGTGKAMHFLAIFPLFLLFQKWFPLVIRGILPVRLLDAGRVPLAPPSRDVTGIVIPVECQRILFLIIISVIRIMIPGTGQFCWFKAHSDLMMKWPSNLNQRSCTSSEDISTLGPRAVVQYWFEISTLYDTIFEVSW